MTKINYGYYIKARVIKNSWINEAAPIVRETWDYLLREANHKEIKYNGFIVKRGQLFRSYKEIIDALKWKVGYRYKRYHESSMKRCMKLLRREGMIELASEPRGNLITIVNYARYQDPSNYERTGEQTDERTSCEPVANQYRSAINKNDKNEKNEISKEGELFSEKKQVSKKSKFVKPTLSSIQTFVFENNYNVCPETFFNHYETVGWKVGKNTMKNWKAAVRGWHTRNPDTKTKKQGYSGLVEL